MLGTVAGAAATRIDASVARAAPEPIPELPLRIIVADEQSTAVVTEGWLDQQVAEARRLMQPHGVFVARWQRARLPEAHARVETTADRDALHRFIEPRVINVFVVASLRDVDDPKRYRMGVRWRLRRDLRKDYVIVSARAIPTVLCHELGHFFGNGHSGVVNNIMSYRRDDPDKVAFDRHQGARMRSVARRLLRTKKVASIEVLRAERDEPGEGA
ncbi:MAG TPA: hypothetical protein ENK57_08630 [Polyangiaceae bacterium]|nr:hypothetical protein [Polyangiaceae bacterium]